MSVWFVIPSKRPLAEANACLDAWQERGYKVAVLREKDDGMLDVDMQIPTAGYIGWARSVNLLLANVMAYDPYADWFVTGGDDYFPDPTKTAEEIAAECKEHFCKVNGLTAMATGKLLGGKTFGVMQPTGDRWGEKNGEATIDRIAGSPWMGREFCRRMYHGAGPMYNGYYHNFADEELQQVAQKLGVFWQRRNLIQEHRHWATARPRSEGHTGISGDVRNMPEWARKINDPKLSDWDKSKALFAARKAAGFPGHEPLEL
jgi:hypothetical protein